MALIALLSARDAARWRSSPLADGSLIDFGGQPLVEYQARLTLETGVDRVIIQVDSPAPDLMRIVDRLVAERGPIVSIVQDMATLARNLGSQDQVLFMAENLIVPVEVLSALLGGAPPQLLALPVVPATSGFELIDADNRWGGALLVDAEVVLGTLDMLGDWDLGLTVLRRALQGGARRLPISPELVMDGRLSLVRDQASAEVALEALSERGQPGEGIDENGLDGLLAAVSRPLVREIVRRQIDPSYFSNASLAIGGIGLLCGLLGWMLPGLAMTLLGLGCSELARQSALVTLRTSGAAWHMQAVRAGAMLLLLLLGWHLSGGQVLALTGAWLTLALVGLLIVTPDHGLGANIWARWARISVAGAVAVQLAGLLLGQPGLAFAALAMLACFAVAVRLLSQESAKV